MPNPQLRQITWIPLHELAEERSCTVERIRQLCAEARIHIPKDGRLKPPAWKKLDRYLYKRYKINAGEPVPGW